MLGRWDGHATVRVPKGAAMVSSAWGGVGRSTILMGLLIALLSAAVAHARTSASSTDGDVIAALALGAPEDPSATTDSTRADSVARIPASSLLLRPAGGWATSFEDSVAKARLLRRERRVHEVGDAGDAVGLLGCTGLFVFMAHDEEKWVAGSNLTLAALIGLLAPSETDTSEFPVVSRLALVGGMGALSAYELRHGAGMSDGRLFWINTGGILLTVLVTNYLYIRF